MTTKTPYTDAIYERYEQRCGTCGWLETYTGKESGACKAPLPVSMLRYVRTFMLPDAGKDCPVYIHKDAKDAAD